MSYSQLRESRQKDDANCDRFDFSWELESIPLLHSGMTETCRNNPAKSVLGLSIFFANGSYRVRIEDRQEDEKAFLELGNLREAWITIEAAIQENRLDWTPDSRRRNGTFGT